MAANFRKGINLFGSRAQNVGDPASPTDGANKRYVDNAVQGLSDLKDPVRVVTTGNIALSGLQSIDGVTLLAGDRVLVKAQTAGAENGIWVAASGVWARAADADADVEVTRGMATTVLEGTTKGTGSATGNPVTFVLTNQTAVTLGTTALTFAPIGAQAASYSAGAGLTQSGQQFAVNAGNGILADGASTRVDPSVVGRVYQADCAATANPQAFVHGLGKRPLVQVVNSATGAIEYPDVTITTIEITVDWGAAPSAGEYRVLAVG